MGSIVSDLRVPNLNEDDNSQPNVRITNDITSRVTQYRQPLSALAIISPRLALARISLRSASAMLQQIIFDFLLWSMGAFLLSFSSLLTLYTYILGALLRCFQDRLVNNFPEIKAIYEQRLLHDQVMEILRRMCNRISRFNKLKLREISVYDAMLEAAKNGTTEFIEVMGNTKPELLWESLDHYNRGVLDYAILHRQESSFTIIRDKLVQGDKNKMIFNKIDIYGNNILHHAAKLPSIPVDRGVSACLQFQREVLWFKKVKKIVNPKIKDAENREGKKAEEMFVESHEELKKEADKWARAVAGSFTTVGTLIITVMFAAAFKYPGGDDANGKTKFLKDNIFKLFLVADAISLFTSSISVLTFIEVLASNHTEEDFLFKLPIQLFFGILNLCIALVSMFMAFCVAFFLMLRGSSSVSLAWTSMGLAILTVIFALLPSVNRLFSQLYIPIELSDELYNPTSFLLNPTSFLVRWLIEIPFSYFDTLFNR